MSVVRYPLQLALFLAKKVSFDWIRSFWDGTWLKVYFMNHLTWLVLKLAGIISGARITVIYDHSIRCKAAFTRYDKVCTQFN